MRRFVRGEKDVFHGEIGLANGENHFRRTAAVVMGGFNRFLRGLGL